MKKFGLLSTSAISSAALFGMSLAFAAPAYAQDQDPNRPDCTDEEIAAGTCDTEVELEGDAPARAEQSLTVTGSRIRTPNITSNVPITSVSVEDLTSQGDVNIGEALNDLPSLRSTFSQANSNRFIGTTGLNLLDLRGLGITRTLVLVNGRRHITALPGDFLVDVQTIPSDLIERVDVITGGNSAVYGSDAVAGVVNFVMRRDFDGIRLRGQGATSQQGDRGIQFVSLTAGRNFLDDRANVAINLEYVNAEPLYFIDRPDLTGAVDGRCQFNIAEFTAGEPPEGDGAILAIPVQCGEPCAVMPLSGREVEEMAAGLRRLGIGRAGPIGEARRVDYHRSITIQRWRTRPRGRAAACASRPRAADRRELLAGVEAAASGGRRLHAMRDAPGAG